MRTYEALVQLLAPELKIDPATIDGARPLTDYGLDSLAIVDLMFLVEEHFGIELPGDTSRFRTLSDLASLIDRLAMQSVD